MTILKILSTYRFSRYYKIGFLVWDVLILNIAIAVSFIARYGEFVRLDFAGVRAVSLLSNIFWVILLLYKGSYRLVRTESIEKILYRTIKMVMVHTAIIAILIVVLKYEDVSRLRMVYFYSIFFVLVLSSRIVFMKILKHVRSLGYNFRKVVIVGANAMGERMNRILSKDLNYGYKVMGFFDDERDDTMLMAPYLGKIADLENYLSKTKIAEMYVALHIDKIKIINQLTNICERYMVRIRYIPDFQQYTKASRVQISFYGNGNVPVLMLRKEPLEINLNRIIKNIFDFF